MTMVTESCRWPNGDGINSTSALQLRVWLFGRKADEPSFQITVSCGLQTQSLILTADRAQRAMLASGWAVFSDYVVIGATHILSGLDHLLFLLVVLVFGCALIHGLALASSLSDLGLDDFYRLSSLAGFNLGVELGPLLVAVGVGLVWAVIGRWCGDSSLPRVTRAAVFAALTIGAVWFLQWIFAGVMA